MLTIYLYSSDDRSHGTAVQPELHLIKYQTFIHQLDQVGVGMQEGGVGDDQVLPGGVERWAGEKKRCNSASMRGWLSPTLW